MLDAYNDPYARMSTAHNRRREFEKLKLSQAFISWRGRQLKVQKGMCAYCKIKLDRKGIVTHIDHVTPLYYDGTNDYKNFVLTCRRCNLRKWVSNRYVVPEWIIENDQKMRKKQRLVAARQQQKALAQELNDEIIWESIRDWV